MAADNRRIVETGAYTTADGHVGRIGPAARAAEEGTRLYGPEPVPLPDPPHRAPDGTRFEVTREDSLVAARRLLDEAGAVQGGAEPEAGTARVAVLVFASARNPGGGYLNGAKAQEEAICRASTLYTCLLRAPDYYAAHRAERDLFYSDRVIHSPAVPVFRDASGKLLPRWYTLGFLTSPAPNTGVVARRAPERLADVPRALTRRAERVLEVAAAEGYRELVLGAWGCGVFGNEPAVVASAFRGLLTGNGRFADHFERAVFAVLSDGHSPALAAFAAAFGT